MNKHKVKTSKGAVVSTECGQTTSTIPVWVDPLAERADHLYRLGYHWMSMTEAAEMIKRRDRMVVVLGGARRFLEELVKAGEENFACNRRVWKGDQAYRDAYYLGFLEGVVPIGSDMPLPNIEDEIRWLEEVEPAGHA
jgi:hypothetical protein